MRTNYGSPLNDGSPSLLHTGHYDVQPAMERDWRTDPFELASIDGYFYARGASDNKVRDLRFSPTSLTSLLLDVPGQAMSTASKSAAARQSQTLARFIPGSHAAATSCFDD